MNQIMWAIFIGPIVGFTILIPFLTADWIIAQAQNATLFQNENNTRTIVNMKDRLVYLVNATTNLTISVSNLPENTVNATATQNLTGDATATQNLTGDATATLNLSEKFKSLQGQ